MFLDFATFSPPCRHRGATIPEIFPRKPKMRGRFRCRRSMTNCGAVAADGADEIIIAP
jgi:hypothetical protein